MLKQSVENPIAVIPFSSMKSENKFTGVFNIMHPYKIMGAG